MATTPKSPRTAKTTRTARTGPPSTRAPRPPACRARVRVYRQGLGDCILVRLPRPKPERDFTILIDCGVVLGTGEPKPLMTRVVEGIGKVTDWHLDVVVATHEHWDHVSGFLQAAATFTKFTVDAVWLGWTEDAKDPMAGELGADRDRALAILSRAMARLNAAGSPEAAQRLEGLVAFFGAAGATTRDALASVRKMSPNVRFWNPTEAPLRIEGTAARIYALGPPRDLKLLRKTLPSRRAPETYGVAEMTLHPAVQDGLDETGATNPFGAGWAIPLSDMKSMPFFQEHYGKPGDANAFRRIDSAWLDSASDLALALDSATNNTSLVLAFELDDTDVLLFAADAQVGNWLSWGALEWSVDGRKVTGPDLLHRTVFYKVGHHGSHNATLREKGLELMKGLQFAIIPVDHEMAVKKKWGRIPLPFLMTELRKHAKRDVLRTDQKPAAHPELDATDDYFELAF